MAFGLRSKRLSIPKGEEPGFTAAVFSRSFRETRGFDHLTARSVHSPKERRISAAILGTEPRKLPSPRRPGFSPGPLRLHLRLQNRGVQNRPGSGLGVRSSPQRRSSEPEYLLAGAGKEPPTLLPPSQQELVQVSQSPATVSEKFALLHRGKFALGTREPDGSRHLSATRLHPRGIPPGSAGTHPGAGVRGSPQTPPPGPQQHPPTCRGWERGLTWALEEEVTEAGGWLGQPPEGAVRRLRPPDSCGE